MPKPIFELERENMPLYLNPDEPLFPSYSVLQTVLASVTNPECHWDLKDIPEFEQILTILLFKKEMARYAYSP